MNSVSEDDYIDLGKAGLGSCLLGGLPDWLIAYSARLVSIYPPPTRSSVHIVFLILIFFCTLKVRFINFERVKLPDEILRHNMEEKKKYFAEICLDVEKTDAEVQVSMVDSML